MGMNPPPDYNPDFHQNTINQAKQAGDAAYQQAMIQYNNQTLALQKAQQAWKETVDKAGLTGMYEGQYTMPSQQWFASTFGSWGTPQAGQQTQSAQQQQWQQAYDLASQYGQYYAPGGAAPQAGQQTLAGQQQQWSQAFQQQQFAAQQQQLQQSNAQQYLQMLSQLRGPADWAKYQQVLGSTPGGMRDLAAAAMGQYVPGGGATTGVAPQAVSLQSMMGQIAGNQGAYAGANPNNAQQTWNNAANAGQQQAPYGQMSNTMWTGGGQAAPQGNPLLSPQAQQYTQAFQQGGAQAANQATQNFNLGAGEGFAGLPGRTPEAAAQQQQKWQQAMGNGTNTLGNPQPQQYNLPAPNQIASQSWNNMAPSQQQMLLGQYESQGWDKNDVQSLMNQSLPKYATNAPGAGTWRLR